MNKKLVKYNKFLSYKSNSLKMEDVSLDHLAKKNKNSNLLLFYFSNKT